MRSKRPMKHKKRREKMRIKIGTEEANELEKQRRSKGNKRRKRNRIMRKEKERKKREIPGIK